MSEKYPRQSIGNERAISLFNSSWWKEKSFRERAEFQLFTDELCMPFYIFHEAIEKTLGRSVWANEFDLSFDVLAAEILGEKTAPTMEEIINLIPEEKRILVVAP